MVEFVRMVVRCSAWNWNHARRVREHCSSVSCALRWSLSAPPSRLPTLTSLKI